MGNIEKLVTNGAQAISTAIQKSCNVIDVQQKPIKSCSEKLTGALNGLATNNSFLVKKKLIDSNCDAMNGLTNWAVNIGKSKLHLEIVKDELERQFIKPFSIKNGAKTQTILPLTYIENSEVKLSALRNLDGISLSSQLSIRFIQKLQKQTGRILLTNYDVFSSEGLIFKIKEVLPPDSIALLEKIKDINPDKYNLVISVLNNTNLYCKTRQGVSYDYISKFVKKLSEQDEKLLKNAIKNNIGIKIYDDMALYPNASHAQYCQGAKLKTIDGKPVFDSFRIPMLDKNSNVAYLQFSEKYNGGNITVNGNSQQTYESLSHELGHAFDNYAGKHYKLQQQDVITSYGQKEFSRYADNVSYSKEFDEAITKDIIAMSENDEKMGRKYGQTFNELLKNPDFCYYFGVQNCNQTIAFDDLNARKELFAQMVSYITSGHVTNKNFENRIEELFPNMLEFVRKLF